MCVATCPAGTYSQLDITGKITDCLNCPPGTLTCTSPSLALTCDATLVKQQYGTGLTATTFCQKECLQGFYPDLTKVCVACATGCLQCSSTTCFIPAPGYYIDKTAGSALIQMTPAYVMTGKYISGDKSIYACDISCATCFGSSTSCTSCPATKFLVEVDPKCVASPCQ